MGETAYTVLFSRRSFRLHSQLVNCGSGSIDSHSYIWNGMKRGSREFVIWQYTAGGEGALDWNGVTWPQTKNCAMLLIVPETHCYYLPEHSGRWDIRFLTLQGAEVVRMAREYRRLHGAVMHLPDHSDLLECWQNIYEQAAKSEIADAFSSSRLAYDFMCRCLSSGTQGSERTEQENLPDAVHAYCVGHLDGEISIGELAAVFHYSRSHFSRRFRAEAGESLQDYLRELRVGMAVRLLQTTRLSVKEIAGKCGFSRPSYFCRVFRECYGVTPAGWRGNRGLALETALPTSGANTPSGD